MTKRHSRHVQVLYGGYNPGTATTQVEVELAQPALETTSMGDPAMRHIANIRADQFTWAGWFDDDTTSMDAAGTSLVGSRGTNTVATVLIGTVVGTLSSAIGYSGQVLMTSVKPAGNVGELARQTAAFSVDQAIDRGNGILIETLSGTATAETNAHDNGAQSTGAGTLYLHVTGGTFGTDGTGTATVHLQHSTSGTGTWGAVATVGGISAVSSFVGTFSTTLRRYLRLQMINAGSSITLAANIKRTPG